MKLHEAIYFQVHVVPGRFVQMRIETPSQRQGSWGTTDDEIDEDDFEDVDDIYEDSEWHDDDPPDNYEKVNEQATSPLIDHE